jgi:hypothetical protein
VSPARCHPAPQLLELFLLVRLVRTSPSTSRTDVIRLIFSRFLQTSTLNLRFLLYHLRIFLQPILALGHDQSTLLLAIPPAKRSSLLSLKSWTTSELPVVEVGEDERDRVGGELGEIGAEAGQGVADGEEEKTGGEGLLDARQT